jgi:hypothetical protein
MCNRIGTAALVFVASAAMGTARDARAQLISVIDRSGTGSTAGQMYYQDVTTGVATQILDPFSDPAFTMLGTGLRGLAADTATRTLWTFSVGSTTNLYAINYADPNALVVTEGARLLRPGTPAGTAPALANNLQLGGLAFDTLRNRLYGVRSLGGQGGEGLFLINTTDGTTTLVLEFESSATSNYQFDGVDYDPVTDRLYLSDDDDTGGRNLYALDAADPAAVGLQLIAAYPANCTDVDGVAAGGGKVVLISDSLDTPGTALIEGNGGVHHVYNTTTMSFEGTLPTPFPERSNPSGFPAGNPSAGGAWVADFFAPPTCPADFNNSGMISVQDIFDFLAAYFGNDPAADFNGQGGISVQDIFDYLAAYFTGCP